MPATRISGFLVKALKGEEYPWNVRDPSEYLDTELCIDNKALRMPKSPTQNCIMSSLLEGGAVFRK